MKRINDCSENGYDFTFKRQEEGKRFVLKSDKKFNCQVVDIDKCVFEGVDIRRCDFLFLVSKNENQQLGFSSSKAYYIELKGISIKDACKQLYHSIDRTKAEILNHEIVAKVIATKGFQPDMENNKYFLKVRRLINRKIEFHKVHARNNYTHTEFLN